MKNHAVILSGVSPGAQAGAKRSARVAPRAEPPRPPLHQNANSHYAATLPLGGAGSPADARGEVAPGIFVCDSASFPDLPAVSLTFTIMAHAHRLAAQSL